MTRLASRPRWRGGNLGAVLIAIPLLVVVVIGTRWAGAAGGGQPEPSGPGPAATSPGPSSTPDQSQPEVVRPVVVRTEPIDVLGPTASMSFPLGDLLSVSPDGRYALVWTATPEMIRASTAEILAIPLSGGDPIDLGTAGYERRSPDDSENRLAIPAWSSDSTRVAFANRSSGIVAALDGTAPDGFAAPSRLVITPVTGGGFVINSPSGPRAVGGARVSPVAPPRGLDPLGYLAGGAGLVGVTQEGELVWVDENGARALTGSRGDRGWRVFARSADILILAPEGRRLDAGVLLVGPGGSVVDLELPDACGIPDVSDDEAYAAYTVCDNSGSADSYRIRLVRLADGAAIDVGQAVGSPKFVPGTHRLAWLGISGNPPVNPVYTVVVATNEVLP